MKSLIKRSDSRILEENLSLNSPKEKVEIRNILTEEQNNYCAYTEEWFFATISIDIEHFDPSQKGTPTDGYENWFAVCHRTNQLKGGKKRWQGLQPVIHPTHPELTNRLICEDGVFFPKYEGDEEIENLIKLVRLNDLHLISDRRKHLQVLMEILEEDFQGDFTKLEIRMKKQPHLLRFRTAIENRFNRTFPSSK